MTQWTDPAVNAGGLPAAQGTPLFKSKAVPACAPWLPRPRALDIVSCSWTLLRAPTALRAELARMCVLSLPTQCSGCWKISPSKHWLGQDLPFPSVQQLFLAPEVPWVPGARPSVLTGFCSPCSMNVQGDYEPIDATGFININSLR